MTALTRKQARFVAEYLIDLNATQAAIRAGYSARNAGKIGPELLGKTRISSAIDEAHEARSQRTGVTADRVVAELAKIGFANMQDFMKAAPGGDPYLDFSALSRDQAAALQEVTVEDYVEGRGEDKRDVKRVKFKLADKRAALVDLGRHLGLFVDRHEHTGRSGGPIETQELSLAERRDRALRHLNEVFAEPLVVVGGSNASGGKANGHADS
jgi:phage terminase small subunit